MDILRFYQRVLPATGIYCLVSPQMRHAWYETIELLAAATQEKTKLEANWYFGTNSFDDAGRRRQENVVAAKSLRFDIDAGEKKYAKTPDKVYRTQEDALVALEEFTAWSGLVPSIVVSSGEGVHVYYCFDEEFPSVAAWKAASTALGRMAKAQGFRADTSVTTDEARILRPVGSLHWNGKHVSVLEENGDLTLAGFLAAFKALNLPAPAAPAAPRPSINADMDEPKPIFAPNSIVKAATKCGWLGEMVAAKGDVEYNDWVMMLSVAKHSAEGEAFAHSWSSGSDEYDEDNTQFKLDSLSRGPAVCDKISEISAHCQKCPHYGQIKSPLQLGKGGAAAASPASPASPAPKAQADDGGFGSFDDVGDADGASVADEDSGVEAMELRGNSTPEELLAGAKKYDMRAELVAQNLLPDDFPTTESLLDYDSKAAFFVRPGRNGRLVLWAFVRELIDNPEGSGKLPIYKPRKLTEQPFYLHSYIAGSGTSEVMVHYIKQYDKQGYPQWLYHDVPGYLLVDNTGLRETLANIGVTHADASDSETISRMIKRFVSANLSVLRNKPATVQIQHHMGFQFLDGEPVYAQGPYVVKEDGEVEVCALGADLRPMRHRFEMPCLPSSELRGYQGDAFEEVILPAARNFGEGIRAIYGEAKHARYQLGWLLGVASPYLMFLTDEEASPDNHTMPGMGITLSLYSSESGLGKTALQKAMVSAFSDPEENKASGDKSSGISAISLGVQLSKLGSLPYMLDEVTNNEPEEVSELIHKISIGRDKVRAQQNGRPVERTGSWTSVTSMSTNVSQRVMLTQHRSGSIAEQMRVVEIDYNGAQPGSMTEYQAAYNKYIVANRGSLGIVLGRYGVMHWKRMRSDAMALLETVVKRFAMPNHERYFARILAAALLAHKVMELHGIKSVDIVQVLKTFAAVMEESRSYISENTPDSDDYLEQFIRHIMPRILRTDTETDVRKANLSGGEVKYDRVDNPEILNRSKIAGRYVAASGRLYVATTEFNTWCSSRGLDVRSLLRSWEKDGTYIKIGDKPSYPKKLSAGIHKNVMPDMQARVYTFSVGHMASKLDLPEGETPENVVQIQRALKTTGTQSAPAAGEFNGTEDE